MAVNGSEWQNGMFCPNGSDRLKAVWMNRNPLDLGHSSYQVYSPMRHHTIPPKQVQGCLSQECFNTSDKEHLFFFGLGLDCQKCLQRGMLCRHIYIIIYIYIMHIPKNMYSRLKRAWALQQGQQLQLVSFSRVWIRGGICSLIII